MYVGIDIGGSKTLVAVFTEEGVITEHSKFPTPSDYDEFLRILAETVATFATKDFQAGGLALPVTVFDRIHGVGISFGNLPWTRVPIHTDIEKLLNCPVAIDNDAKLGGLSEALLLKDEFHKVLYLTVSTGIGYALIADGIIDENAGDGGGRALLMEHDGKLMPWEDFASGRAIVEHYGKKAVDIHDEATWQRISRDLSSGLIELIAVFEPDVVVIGGSVGTYFDRFGHLLETALRAYQLPLVTIPVIQGAQRAEEAVVYGCYDLAKRSYADAEPAHH